MISVSKREARQIVLSAQGLGQLNPFGLGLTGTKKAIEHLGYIQIDTISVVERAHHHVLWSRVKDYEPSFLGKLLEKKQVFEYWSHAASYLPMRDFRFSLPRKQRFASGEWQWFKPTPENLRLKVKVLDRIRSEGPLSARDFTAPESKKTTGWWDWKPAKKALEQLFLEGQLMVLNRRRFEKVYDLTERVLPRNINVTPPSPVEHARHLIKSAVRSHGLVQADEISYLRSAIKKTVQTEFLTMVNEGELQEVRVEGLERSYFGIQNKWEDYLNRPFDSGFHVLSPFDNQVIQRKRLRELFGFDYTIECYVPASKRKFGYFSLPLLKGNSFVGRVDAKAERARKVLTVRALHVERGCGRKADLWIESRPALKDFAHFNGCEIFERA